MKYDVVTAVVSASLAGNTLNVQEMCCSNSCSISYRNWKYIKFARNTALLPILAPRIPAPTPPPPPGHFLAFFTNRMKSYKVSGRRLVGVEPPHHPRKIQLHPRTRRLTMAQICAQHFEAARAVAPKATPSVDIPHCVVWGGPGGKTG